MLNATILLTRFLTAVTPLILRLLGREALRSLTHALPAQLLPTSCACKKVAHPKQIVVVGASFAGYHAARELAASVVTGWRVVVVEKRSHFRNTWVLPRFSVVEGHEGKAFIPYGGYVRRGEAVEWVTGEVVGVEVDGVCGDGDGLLAEEGGSEWGENLRGGYVTLDDGSRIRFEYLVVATGSFGKVPSRIEAYAKTEGMQELRDVQRNIKEAKRIAVIGGGAVGVELAADAKTYYPDKEVVLVHSRDRLLHHFGPKIHEVAVKGLEAMGVEVILGERMVAEDSGGVTLKSGRRIESDYTINCIGQKPSSSIIKSLSPSSISPSGAILVKPTLQLKDPSYPHVFAIGEVVDFGKHLNSRSAFLQAEVASRNINAHIADRGGAAKLEEYHPQWWENALELTLGIGKTVYYMRDGERELVMEKKGGRIDLKSMMSWKYLGATPYEEPPDPHGYTSGLFTRKDS